MKYAPSLALALAAALAAALALPGCLVNTDEGRVPGTCNVLEPVEVQAAPLLRFVVDSIALPTSASLSQQLGMDLDLDPQARPDNALGQVLSTVFNATDTDVNALLASMVADGRILHLMQLETSSLVDADGVGLTMFVGADANDEPSDNFGGQASFAVVPTRVSAQPLTGRVRDGVLLVDVGVVPLQIALPHVDEPFVLELRAARIEATVTADGIDGRLAGVLDLAEIDDAFIPIIHTSLDATIAEDCPGGACEPDSNGALFLELFDTDLDGAISDAEFRANALLQALLAPDVDMFDSDGALVTRCNDVKDGLSVGVAFTAVPARF